MTLIPGFWMNAAEVPADFLFEVTRRGLARGHTVANGVTLAKELYKLAAVVNAPLEPIIIVREDISFDQNYRDTRYEPKAYAASAKRRLAAAGFPEGYWQIWNEPIFANLAEFRYGMQRAIDLMTEFQKQGVRFSIGGWADAATWHRELLEAGEADKFLEVVGQLTNEGAGVDNDHNYVYGSLAHNGGGKDSQDMLDPAKLKREGWPRYDDMNTAPAGFLAQSAPDLDSLLANAAADYLLSYRGVSNAEGWAHFADVHHETPKAYRASHFDAQAADSNWTQMRYVWKDIRAAAKGYQPALRFIGEGFWDDMPHGRAEGWIQAIEQKYVSGRKLRGTLDQRDLWPKFWPGQTEVESYIEQIDWWVSVQPDNVVGASGFCINRNVLWGSFNLEKWVELWPAWYEYAFELKAKMMAAQEKPALPKPNDCGTAVLSEVQTGLNDHINVRHRPHTKEGKVIYEALQGDRVYYYPEGHVTADGYDWAYVDLQILDSEGQSQSGWMALLGKRTWEQQFKPLIVPTTPPIEPPPVVTPPPPTPTPTIPPIMTFPPLPEIVTATSESREQWSAFFHWIGDYIKVYPGVPVTPAIAETPQAFQLEGAIEHA